MDQQLALKAWSTTKDTGDLRPFLSRKEKMSDFLSSLSSPFLSMAQGLFGTDSSSSLLDLSGLQDIEDSEADELTRTTTPEEEVNAQSNRLRQMRSSSSADAKTLSNISNSAAPTTQTASLLG